MLTNTLLCICSYIRYNVLSIKGRQVGDCDYVVPTKRLTTTGVWKYCIRSRRRSSGTRVAIYQAGGEGFPMYCINGGWRPRRTKRSPPIL